MICPQCGTATNQRLCPECGAPVEADDLVEQKAETAATASPTPSPAVAHVVTLEQDQELLMAALREGKISAMEQPADLPVLLKKGERVFLVLADIVLQESRSVSTGVYGGPSLRIAKGVSLRLGGFRAQSHEELKAIDQGVVVLTNKRLIFSGSLRSVDVTLSRLTSVEPYRDAIAIGRVGKQKTEYFVGLDEHTYSFTVDGRHRTVPLSGSIVKSLIEGQLAVAG